MDVICKYLPMSIVTLVLVGCASTAQMTQNGSSALESKVKLNFISYKNCMETAADYYSSSEASPNELAEAAQSRCGGQFYAYEQSIEDYFVSLVSRSGATMARKRARTHAQATQSKLKGRVIQLVIEKRLQR